MTVDDVITAPRAAHDAAPDGAAGDVAPPSPWLVLSQSGRPEPRTTVDPRRIVMQVAATAALVILVVAVVGAVAARRMAEREAIDDASRRADLIADAVLQPALSDGLLRGDPGALRTVDRVVRDRVIDEPIVRVKLWSADGRVVYSDEPRLIGQHLTLGEDEQEALDHPLIRAEVTDLSRPENQYERGQGKLLEVYRRVTTSPSGTPLLFETYSTYDEVSERGDQIWRGFVGLMVSSLLLLTLLHAPLLWRLLRRIRCVQEQREALLLRAVDASDDERRRIAGRLHDGVVQELAASSFALAGSIERAEQEGSPALAAQLRETAATVRGSIGGLRSLLVDIYPRSLSSAGLAVTLQDLAGPLRARNVEVLLDVPAATDPHRLSSDTQRLVYRIVHECLANVAKHAAASSVVVRLREDEHEVVLDVVDDGLGFDPAAVMAEPAPGHLGLRVLADLTREAGATLKVASKAGHGTWWQLRVIDA